MSFSKGEALPKPAGGEEPLTDSQVYSEHRTPPAAGGEEEEEGGRRRVQTAMSCLFFFNHPVCL